MTTPRLDAAAIDRAARRLGGVALRTPILTSVVLDERAGAPVFCKAEGLQRTGSFKLRGAWNAVAALDAQARSRGVLTYSSGNHGRALAFVARAHQIPVAVVFPTGGSAVKRRLIAREGAELIGHDPALEDRVSRARAEAARRGMILIPPYDHADVIAGQGTVARELLQDASGLTHLLAPVGGGGLLAGCAVAAAHLGHLQVVGVEPRTVPKTSRSLALGKPVPVPAGHTLADALRATVPGSVTFPVLRELGARTVTVDDRDLRAAMRLAFDELGLVCEPSGAAALAAVMSGAFGGDRTRLGLVLSGSNIDVDGFAAVCAGGTAATGPFPSA